MTINVRQRQYGIAKAGRSTSNTLLTKDINTCTGLLGIDEAGDVAFMVHLDTPCSAWSISSLVDDLGELGHDIRDFRIFHVAGKRRALTFISGFIAVAMSILSLLQGNNAASLTAPIAAIAAIVWGMSGMTRSVLWFRLWQLKARPHRPIVYRRSKGRSGLGITDVSLQAEKAGEPCLQDSSSRRDPSFKLAKGNGRWLTKASGSA